ncbi:uroporphyrinogen-III synthase [Nitrospinae bacterium AH_259_B05_G02_I21]|nr:uroporphyrinogen-III synthase [Nitrospinae bacterium AH_259_B05_G02_I21]MDA2932548.1 uroporphyrinogen-III synthase [Nitrospinae bacterium AH-259-F20]
MASPRGKLAGRTFIVPRTSGGRTTVSALLAAEGATVVEFPAVSIGPPPEPEALDTAIGGLEAFDWVVFCHVSAARFFLDRFIALRGGLEPLAQRCRLAAVGPERREALEAYGLSVEVTPGRASPRALVAALAEAAGGLAGLQVLVVSGEAAEQVAEGLAEGGSVVALVQAARREPNTERRGEVAGMVAAGEVSGVVFLSAGGVEQLRAVLEEDEALASLLAALPAYAASPKTAQRAKALGFREIRYPAKPSRQALVETILADHGALGP